jgi:hypothetical protein
VITVKAVRQACAEHRAHVGDKAPTHRGRRMAEYKPRYARCCIKDHKRRVKLSPLGPVEYGRILYIKVKEKWQDRGAICLDCITAIRTLIKEAAE